MSGDDIAIKVSNLSKCYQIYNQPNDRLKQFIVPKIVPKKQMLCENIERKYQRTNYQQSIGRFKCYKATKPFTITAV